MSDCAGLVVGEITEDEIRDRAKAIIRRNGWLEQKAPPSLISALELMVALGLDVVKNPPSSCDHPHCGRDAICREAIAALGRVQPAFALIEAAYKEGWHTANDNASWGLPCSDHYCEKGWKSSEALANAKRFKGGPV